MSKQASLNSRSSFFEKVCHLISDLIIIVNSEKEIIFCNHAAEHMIGIKANRLIGENIFSFFSHTLPSAIDALNELVSSKQHSMTIETIIKPNTVSSIPIKLSMHKIHQRKHEEYFAIIAHDTTRSKILNEEKKERMLAVSALIESEERYRQIIHTIEDGYFEVDLKGNLTFFNDSLQRIIGYPKERMRGMNYREFIDDENAQKVFSTFNRVYKTGISEKAFDWELISADGSRHIIETSVSLMRQHDGKPIGFRGIVRDITQRKEVERKLRQSEERLRKFVNTAADIIWFANANGRITFINPAGLQTLQLKPSEIIGKHCFEFIHPNYRKKAAFFYLRQFAKRDPISYYEFPVSVGNETKWFGQTLQLIIDNEKVVEFIGIARDITKKKAFEEHLKQSEERYRSLAEFSSDIISEIDINGHYTYVSSNVYEILGFTPNEVIGKRFTEFVYSKDIPEAERIWNTKIPEFALRFIHKSGGFRWLDCASRIFKLSDGTERIVTISRDITERKKEEERIRESEMRLRLQQMALAELAKHESLHHGDVKAAFKTINIVACHILNADACGIWLLQKGT
ncbi:MAG: PAS domain S-box protein, partial [Spirochaetes bacterium]|nr:PAS domain S-box protein [Spirochaetota bacterium]